MEKEDLDSLIGQLLTATFLEVNPETNKLVLSQREIARAAAIGKLEAGVLKEGKVVNIKPYGVFVDLNGVSGLLHVTEISDNRVESLTDLFQILENYPGEMLEKMDEVMENAEERIQLAKEKLVS
jgi:small subunit ribosomal protein S1